jgi:hypothetical protein
VFFLLLVWIFQNLKEFKSELLLMSVLIRFCLIDGIKESFNIKVEKGYVLMRNLKDLVGTEDFLNSLELTFHHFLHLINFASFLSTCCWLFLVYVIHICHPIFKLRYLSSTIFFLFQKYGLIFIQRSVCVWSRKMYFKVQVSRFILSFNNSHEIFIIKMVIICRFNK